MVSDPDECVFYPQLITIRDCFQRLPMEEVYGYFKQLDEVLNEEKTNDPVSVQIASQVHRIRKLAKKAKNNPLNANSKLKLTSSEFQLGKTD